MALEADDCIRLVIVRVIVKTGRCNAQGKGSVINWLGDDAQAHSRLGSHRLAINQRGRKFPDLGAFTNQIQTASGNLSL
jgi:hypothetical protein